MPLNFGRDIVPITPTAIASYDYIDIAQGTGIVILHGGANATSSGGFSYNLSRNLFYSDQIASGGSTTTTAFAKVLDVNFDVTFIRPQIIDGKALINIPIGVEGAIAASNYQVYPVVAVKKVVDGTEITLFALTSGSLIKTAQTFDSKYDAIIADLPLTNFRSKDILRLQVQLYNRGNGGDTGYGLLGMDPKNRKESSAPLNWSAGDADLQFHVPFKLNI